MNLALRSVENKQEDNSSAIAAIGGAPWLAIKAYGQPAMFRTQVAEHLTSTTQDNGASSLLLSISVYKTSLPFSASLCREATILYHRMLF